ncbi:hypothetical protein Dred_2722 [Desulforamulus reducens MI-1]|uniref:DUF2325 domain-containing protein n=1 Tax=Desulforamulus reducens (strain ATCC BAA-1160 / DSM 100696 / MI-1) TaxID=349161 RepID=A4J823_DESRM|nr:DUF2325 domain-containing protein [Desulforamulus reducens]ABO51226.1 hypothetical protein Dred_2722 [Desulforamulus reducens MI-1]
MSFQNLSLIQPELNSSKLFNWQERNQKTLLDCCYHQHSQERKEPVFNYCETIDNDNHYHEKQYNDSAKYLDNKLELIIEYLLYKLIKEQRELIIVKQQYQREQQRNKQLAQELTTVKTASTDFEQKAKKLQHEKEELLHILEDVEQDLRQYEKRNSDLEDENLSFLVRIDELQSKIRDLHQQYYCSSCPKENDTESCPKVCCNNNSRTKRILMVGGITKIEARYRSLIEDTGNEFEYLDGYMKGGEKVLDSKIRRCDLVLCPVDCNSHNACVSVKKLCKKYGKPFKMLTSSSVSGIAQVIR